MAHNLVKKRVILFIFLSIFFVSVSSLHGSPFPDPDASGMNTGMKLAGGRSGRGGRHFRGRARIPLNGGSGAQKSHRSSAASRGSYSSLVLLLAAAAAGAAIL